MPSLDNGLSGQPLNSPQAHANNTTNTLKRQEADALFTEYLNANKQYAQIKEAMKDKFSKAITKGMDKKTLKYKINFTILIKLVNLHKLTTHYKIILKDSAIKFAISINFLSLNSIS